MSDGRCNKTPEADLKARRTECWNPGCKHRAFLRDWKGWQWCWKDWYREIRWGGGERYWWYVWKTRIFLTVCLTVLLTISVKAQTVCPTGSQCLDNASIDKCNAIATEIVGLRKLAADLPGERAAHIKLETDLQAEVAKLKERIAIDDLYALSVPKAIELLKSISAMKDDLLALKDKKLANQKGFWAKVLAKLELLYYAIQVALLIKGR